MWAVVFVEHTINELSLQPRINSVSQIPTLLIFSKRYVQGYETASKRAFVISIAFGLMSQPIKFRFSSLQTTAVVPEPK
jgi:hypothetical protein